MSKVAKVLFTFSILLNIACLGVIGGHSMKKMKGHSWKGGAYQELAPETRALMWETLRAKRDKIKSVMAERRDRQKALSDLLSAAEFDVDAFRVEVESWKEFNATAIDGKLETMISMASQLPQAEREKLSKRFVDVLTGDGKRRGGREHDSMRNGSKSKNNDGFKGVENGGEEEK